MFAKAIFKIQRNVHLASAAPGLTSESEVALALQNGLTNAAMGLVGKVVQLSSDVVGGDSHAPRIRAAFPKAIMNLSETALGSRVASVFHGIAGSGCNPL